MTCKLCGNEKLRYYGGALGYEAMVCDKCGAYHDHYGVHPKDCINCETCKKMDEKYELMRGAL